MAVQAGEPLPLKLTGIEAVATEPAPAARFTVAPGCGDANAAAAAGAAVSVVLTVAVTSACRVPLAVNPSNSVTVRPPLVRHKLPSSNP